jgi:hypothetical protein
MSISPEGYLFLEAEKYCKLFLRILIGRCVWDLHGNIRYFRGQLYQDIASELRGTAYEIYNVVIGFSFFISNIVFGFLLDKYSLNIASYYSMTFALAGIIGMLVFVTKFPIGSTSLGSYT